MIVVGIECGHENDERLYEYCPYQVAGGFLRNVHGRCDDTMQWIVNEYRTYIFREATGIGGSSMGGLMALYGSLRYNRWFSKAACVSSAIYPCMRQLYEEIRCSSISPDTRIYLSWGNREARKDKES